MNNQKNLESLKRVQEAIDFLKESEEISSVDVFLDDVAFCLAIGLQFELKTQDGVATIHKSAVMNLIESNKTYEEYIELFLEAYGAKCEHSVTFTRIVRYVFEDNTFKVRLFFADECQECKKIVKEWSASYKKL